MAKNTYKINYILKQKAGIIQKKTGIPASLISKIKKGTVKLSAKSKAKITRVYDKEWKKKLSDAGVPKDVSKYLITNFKPSRLQKERAEYNRIAKIITQNKNIKLAKTIKREKKWKVKKERKTVLLKTEDIKKGMRLSKREDVHDWILYCKEKKYISLRQYKLYIKKYVHPEAE